MARGKGTRERILDVALDLFVEEGYDKASLREIAERLELTKAALYYHFPSKADILMALHMRLHALSDEPLKALGDGPVSLAGFEAFVDKGIDLMERNTKLLLLHFQNQTALAEVHVEGHEAVHADLGERVQLIFTDPSLAPEERLRMAAAFAAAMVTPIMAGALLGTEARKMMAPALRKIVHTILHAPISDREAPPAPALEGLGGAPEASEPGVCPGPAPAKRERGRRRATGRAQ